MAPTLANPITSLSSWDEVFNFVVTEANGVKGLSDLGLTGVPNQYVQPVDQRIHTNQQSTSTTKSVLQSQDLDQQTLHSIPIIDLKNWEWLTNDDDILDNDHPIGKSICDAAEKWGFFQIINHGVPLEVLDNVIEAAHRFFALPASERRKYVKENLPQDASIELLTSFSPQKEKVLEWKDFLMHAFYDDDFEQKCSSFWPSVSREQTLEYFKCVKPLIKRLLTVLLKGVGLKEMDDKREHQLMGLLMANFNYYPICPTPEVTAGTGRHSDISSITVLHQDSTGGLYVKAPDWITEEKVESWIHVTPIREALVINIGDVLQIVSNDRYKSIEHRVIPSSAKNRVSVPIFADPPKDATIGPLPEILERGDKAIYKDILYSDYFKYFFGKPHDGKGTIECARV
ncbi:feruloyl CoA ortho-hydroxylase F6H1-3-like [Impatiens glandulifera]|uniref:feruloyl CoA ortho-hydroxylase F6H1-3-like n=1 Tax=Impatiens glandulifera TaxID=253017 RepID=UPI001FB0DE6F|nr:feruloyl CoA ortho-hydroxylase F6H1-3-like [Impatiens glandulifera]